MTLLLPHTKFSGVFERRTATESLFISLDATTFVLIRNTARNALWLDL